MANIIVGIIIFALLLVALFYTITKKTCSCGSDCTHCKGCGGKETPKIIKQIKK